MNRTKCFNTGSALVSILLLIITLSGLFSPVLSQEVSLEKAMEVGQIALVNGDVTYAETVAKAILKESPNSVQAYLFLSSVFNIKGGFKASHDAAKTANKLSATQDQKHNSALALGVAAANANRQLMAEYWLRKSLNYTRDVNKKRFAVSLLGEVRKNSPWRRSLSFGVTPSSNINGGSSANEIIINDLEFILDPNAKSIKGLGFNYGFGISYQKKKATDVTFFWSADVSGVAYKIYPTAEQEKLGVKASDYDYHRASMRAGYAFGKNSDHIWLRQMVFATDFSQDWYGGNVLANTAGVAARKSIPLNQTSRLLFKLAYEKRFRKDLTERTSTAKMMDIQYDKLFSSEDLFSFKLYASDRSSLSAEIANVRMGAEISYKLNPQNLSFQPEFILGYDRTLFDRPFLTSDRRIDKKLTVGVSVKLLKLSYFGFNPTIGYTYQKTTSNNSLHNSYRSFFRVGLQSQF